MVWRLRWTASGGLYCHAQLCGNILSALPKDRGRRSTIVATVSMTQDTWGKAMTSAPRFPYRTRRPNQRGAARPHSGMISLSLFGAGGGMIHRWLLTMAG